MVGDEDPDTRVRERPNDVLDLVDGYRVDAGEGLVEEEEFGLDGEGPGDLGPSALAAREGEGRLLPNMANAEFLQEAVEALAALGLRPGRLESRGRP